MKSFFILLNFQLRFNYKESIIMNAKYLSNSLFILCYFIVTLFMSACSNELETIETENQQISSIKDNHIQILQSLGFETTDIIELEGYYLIEGDILFEKSKLSSYNNVETRQAYHTSGLISYSKQSTITVGIDSSVPTSGVDNWRDEILEAIKLWNPLSHLKLTYTTDANPDILVRSDNNSLPDNVIAAGEFPMSGQPGSTIRINFDFYGNKTIPSLQKIYNMVHELGHCFGLRHTNWISLGESPAINISGTPTSDPNSVMNGGTADSLWKGFSGYDITAIKNLYPNFSASFFGFPTTIRNFGTEQFKIIVSCSHPIVNYDWNVTAGYLVKEEGDTATVIFGSPITSSVSVYVTTTYGEKYYITEDYQTHTFTYKRVN